MNAKFSGQKSYMEGRFEAILGEVRASRAESHGFFQSLLSEIKAIRAESQGQYQTLLAKIEASGNRMRLCVLLTGVAAVSSVGLVAASVAIWKTFSGN